MWHGFEFGYVERQLQDTKQKCVWQQFPDLKRDTDEPSLQLADYLLVEPQKYFSRSAFREVHDWLMPRVQKSSGVFLDSLYGDIAQVNQAIREMREINRQINNDPWHDQAMPSSDILLQQLCREFVLPRYLNLTEAVYLALIKPIVVTMRIDRDSGIDDLQKNNHTAATDQFFASAMPITAATYDPVVRNALAHNKLAYVGPVVRFTDEGAKGTSRTVEVLMGSVIRLFDYAVDVCNALVLAYCVVLTANRGVLALSGHKLPDELLIGELIARMSTRAWAVTRCEKAPAIDNQSQLVVKVQETVRTQNDFVFNLHRTAAWVQALMPGYTRYLVQTSSRVGKPGLYSFSGPRLDDANNGPQDNPELYADTVIQESCVDFNKRHDWPRSIHRLWLIGEAGKSQLARARLLHYSESTSVLLIVRDARATRDHFTVRLWARGAPTFERPSGDISALIDSQAEHVLRGLTRAALRVASHHPAVTIAPKYVCLDLFSRDLRVREMQTSHLRPELICRLEYAESDSLFPKVTLMGGKVERRGRIRITWNSRPVPYNKDSWFC